MPKFLKRKRTIIMVMGAALAGLAFLGLYISSWESREPALDVHFFHQNRGHSVFIRTPHGKTILIDTGQTGDIIAELTTVFPFYKRRIDTLILTNGLPKQTGGAREVLSRFEVERIFEPVLLSTSTAYTAYLKLAEEKNIPIQKVKKGDKFMIDGVTLSVLFPDVQFKFNKTSMPELVLKIEYASTTMLLLGDVSRTIQKSLLKELGDVTLVEFAHAGAKSRVSGELLGKAGQATLVTSKRNETMRYSFK
jgi:competence protein ComEC